MKDFTLSAYKLKICNKLAVFADRNFIRKSVVCQPILHINLTDSLDKCTRSNFSISYFNDLPVCSFAATWGEILTQCLRSSLPALSDSPQNTLFEMHLTKNLVHQEGKQVWGAEGYKTRLETVAWAEWEMPAWNLRSPSWALTESLGEMFSSFLFEKQSRNNKKRLLWKCRCKFSHWFSMTGMDISPLLQKTKCHFSSSHPTKIGSVWGKDLRKIKW